MTRVLCTRFLGHALPLQGDSEVAAAQRRGPAAHLWARAARFMRPSLLRGVVALLVLAAVACQGGSPSLPRGPLAAPGSDMLVLTSPEPGSPEASPTATATPQGAGLASEPQGRMPAALVAPADLRDVAERFDTARALGTVRQLTGPEFAGRQAGDRGSLASAEYIAERFQSLGLRPAGTDGYLQALAVPYGRLVDLPCWQVAFDDGRPEETMTFAVDFRPAQGAYAGGGLAEGRICWVASGKAENYEGLDVLGQIALTDAPPEPDLVRTALDHGVAALLSITADERVVTLRGAYRPAPYLHNTIPILRITKRAADLLLGGTAYTVEELSVMRQSTWLAISTRIEVPMMEPGYVPGHNVLGILPGTDPLLRSEVLILGAHYDHLGSDPDGRVYDGANDNASGVATLIEIARTWQEAGYAPPRSVLFAAWDGEEQGLLGSKYYVSSPTYPLTQTIGMIQLDMVGLATEGMLCISSLDNDQVPSAASNPVAEQLGSSARLLGLSTRPTGFRGGSDHAPFEQAGIPASLLIWDDGEVPLYHTPQDRWQTLQPARLWQAGAVATHAAMVLASEGVDTGDVPSEQE